MPTRDLANRRVTFLVGPAGSIANLQIPTVTECASLLKAHSAIRWNGLDFGVKASDKVDDRTLDDSATAQLRGFLQFGGAIPFFMPKKTDTTSILRQVFNLFKTPNTLVQVVERVGYAPSSQAIAAGDVVNTYLALTGGYKPDTEGTGGYAYLSSLIPQGIVYPWTIIPNPTPAAITIVGGATLSITVASNSVGLRGATYQGQDITTRATWTSSNPAVATVDNRGVIKPISAGSATITPSYPGAAASTGIAVTVT